MFRTFVGLVAVVLVAVGAFVAFNQPSGATLSDETQTAVCACGQCDEGCKCCSSDAVSCSDCSCKLCVCEVCKDKAETTVVSCTNGKCESAGKCCSSDKVACEDCVCTVCACEVCKAKAEK